MKIDKNKLRWRCLLLAGIFLVTMLAGCTKWEEDYEWQEGDFTLELYVDKTDVILGDEIEITAILAYLQITM